MVDTVFVFVDGVMGGNHASPKENAKDGTADCVYGSECLPRFFVWYVVCTSPGPFIWFKFERNAGLDCIRTAMGFCSWCKQFYLWSADCADSAFTKKTGKQCKLTIKKLSLSNLNRDSFLLPFFIFRFNHRSEKNHESDAYYHGAYHRD